MQSPEHVAIEVLMTEEEMEVYYEIQETEKSIQSVIDHVMENDVFLDACLDTVSILSDKASKLEKKSDKIARRQKAKYYAVAAGVTTAVGALGAWMFFM